MLRLFAAIALFFGLHGLAMADSWPSPTVQTTLSANEAFRFTVTPREVKSQLAYFEAKAAGKDLPSSTPATGLLERRNGTKWETVWRGELVNEVAPVTTLVSDDGKWVVTFDNWHSVGFGANVVVIYGEKGQLVRSLKLDDLMPGYFLDGLPRSISSLWWQSGPPRLREGTLEIPIADLDREATLPAFYVSISLTDGSVLPMNPEVIKAVNPRFCAAHTQSVQSDNAILAFHRSDLVAPTDGSKDAWTRYQHHAVSRLSSSDRSEDLGGILPSFELLLPGEYMFKEFREHFRAALTTDASEMPIRWFSSRNLESMTIEVEKAAPKIKPGQLAGVEMHFLTDKAHWPRLQSALAKSGAILVLVDIKTPIPQKPEVLAELPADRIVDPACKH